MEIAQLDNPRVEAEEHYYNAAHTKLLELGLEPHLLGDELVRSMLGVIARYRDRVIAGAIPPSTRWRPVREAEPEAARIARTHTNGRSNGARVVRAPDPVTE